MSEENLDLIRESYDAWNRQEIEFSPGHLTDDFEFWPLDGFMDLDEVDVELEIANIFTIRDGLMSKVQSLTWGQALQAVGLPE